MNRGDRAKRNGEIVVAVEIGEPIEKVAVRYELSEQTVRLVLQKWRRGELETQLPGAGERPFVPSESVARALLETILAEMREDRELGELPASAEASMRLERAQRRAELAARHVRFLAALAGPDPFRIRNPDLEWLEEVNTLIKRALEEHTVAAETADAVIEAVVEWFADKTGIWEALGVRRPE